MARRGAKRLLDLVFSACALTVSLPLFAIVAMVIKIDSPGPIFYGGVRVGRFGVPFRMFKFRSMVVGADLAGGPSCAADDPRITRAGKWIRRLNLDELPQFINVLLGQMSIVGPRPEVPEVVALYPEEERRMVLSVRPGITDLATLWIRDEGKRLVGSPDPHQAYLEDIWPTKRRLQMEYVRSTSLRKDLRIMGLTLKSHLLNRLLPNGPSTARELEGGADWIMPASPPRSSGLALGAANGRWPDHTLSAAAPSPTFLQRMYMTMLRIRMFEERVAELVEAGEIKTPCHLYIGQEAVATGVCLALRRADYIFGTHRSHGHYLAKGGNMAAMMAEIFGKQTGCSQGRGGSMHLIAPEVGLLGTVPIVSGTIPLAVGTALASRLQGKDTVSVAFFGDGALEEGTAHESLNLAAHRKLPVLFVCENNFYSSHLSLRERRALDNIPDTGAAHGMPGVRVDGNDVTAVYTTAADAVRRGRAGEGPTLLECRTFRWRGHVGPSWDLDVGVKRKDELREWLQRDPVARARDRLLANGVPPSELDRIREEIRAEVQASEAHARESPYPDASMVLAHVFYQSGENLP